MVPNPPSHSSLSCEEMDHRVANGRRDGSTVRPQLARCNSALSDGVRTGRSNRTDDRKVLDVTPHWAMALGQDDPTAQTTVTSRNQRSKGFAMKNALQVCLLVIVCAWILYQIKHSHDKKGYGERSSKISYMRQPESNANFHRKELPYTGRSDAVTQTKIEGGRKDGDEDITQELKHKQVGNGDETNGRIEEPRVVDNQTYEDASREAREKSFTGDDASSEVVPTTPEVENQVAPHAAEKGSLKDYVVSSSVDHVIESEDVGIRNLDENLMESVKKKDEETKNEASESLEQDLEGSDSSASEQLDFSEANNPDAGLEGNQTRPLESEVRIPTPENRFQENTMRDEEPGTHNGQNHVLTTANAIDNQTELRPSSNNQMNVAATKSTSVSHNKSDHTKADPKEVNGATNWLHSVQGQNATVDTRNIWEKSSFEYGQTNQSEKSKTTNRPEEQEKSRPEEQERSSETFSTPDGMAKTVSGESADTLLGMIMQEQEKAKGRNQEAAE
ncbi:hypothetical protein B296_00027289 [Ensete ventricosum]|uniref:Uncharacterized protein n=1 Tax=Ensete ventricosum TaxID=4639 RepID=A0A426YCC2_ENSVE|nr:hypothetical protein B296_00027289 [Ensete ventricosum]